MIRGAASPRSASPIGPAPTRLPRIAFPPAIRDLPFLVRQAASNRSSRPMPTMAAVQTSATAMVKRSRFFSATEDPPRLDETPPPNMSDSPPPLPLCRRMSMVWKMLVTTSTTCKLMRTALTMDPSLGGSVCGWCSDQSTRSGPADGSAGHVVTVPADAGELVGLEARAADQGAVHVGLSHDRRDVGRLHRAAVQHPHGVRDVAGVELGQAGADRRADFLRVLGGGDLARPDRPDRL